MAKTMTFYAAISSPVLCTGDMSARIIGKLWTSFLPGTLNGFGHGQSDGSGMGCGRQTLELPKSRNFQRTGKVKNAHL
jgi:hypothetical protein